LSETTRSGRRIARVKEGDEVVTCTPAEGDTITAVTKTGKALTFPAEELPELAGAGRGVILMRLDKEDRLVGAVTHDRATLPVAVADNGETHRFNLPEAGHRAQKGRKVFKRYKPMGLISSR
jgi:DNA gyrase/topoisomerase IV subunit A